MKVGLIAKVVLLGLLDALVVSSLPGLVSNEHWVLLVGTVLATAVLNYLYLSRRRIPAKFLVPSTILLAVFLVYPVLYTVFVAFTNYSTGHILSKDQAIERILASGVAPVEDGPSYKLRILLGADDEVAFLLTDEGGKRLIGNDEGLAPTDQGLGSYRLLTLREAQRYDTEVDRLSVPTEDGEIRAETFTRAKLYERTRSYDSGADTITDRATGLTYESVRGSFVSDSGERLTPGWRVPVGADNFQRIFANEAIRGPFLKIFAWTCAFAVISVLVSFAVGLLLALVLGDKRMRGQKIYRALLIIPFALPSFITALIWKGMFNNSFGLINNLLHADIPWLLDPTLAKIAVLIVNVWLGFPYWFVVTTGALQAIPPELKEAARVDGASEVRVFGRITLPLLLAMTVPLFILSFAFNFNNFNVIYLITGGGPPMVGAQTPAGHTDLLITYTYRLAFGGAGTSDYGLASAISLVIFVLVAIVSFAGFRSARRSDGALS